MTTKLWPLAADLIRRARANPSGDARVSPLPEGEDKTVIAVQQALVRRRRHLGFRRAAIRVTGLAGAATVLIVAARLILSSGPLAEAPVAGSAHVLSVLEPAQQQGRLNKIAAAVIGDGWGSRSATDGMTLQTGIRLLAPPDGEVRIGSADGTVLTLETDGELAVVEQSSTRKFSLRRGAVRAQVAKLQNNERFIIATADAEVEVHGTTFRVSMTDSDPACANGVRTRVSVFEGVVSVRVAGSESFVSAGATWPSCVAGPSAVGTSVVGGSARLSGPTITVGSNRAGAPRHLTRKRAAGVSQPDDGALVPRVTPPSPIDFQASSRETETAGLAAANDLFAAAIHARRQERPADAVRLFSRLIETAPDSPLVEGARVQKMKLLARIDRGAARKAAGEYLALYPQGFARDDARRLLGSAP